MRQLICPATGQLELIETPVPRIGPGELLIRFTACGLCGTDLMKVYSDTVAKPVQLGHELVGEVAEVGSGVKRFQVGQRVAVAHHAPDYSSHYTRRGSATMDPLFKRSNIDPGGFADFIRVPALLVTHTVEPIPATMPDLRAIFMEPLACCLRALARVNLCAGDTALIVGVGAVGLLFAPLLRDQGVTVLATDVRQERLDLAGCWGAAAAGLNEIGTAVKDSCSQKRTNGVDLVILTALNGATLTLATQAVRDGGALLLFGAKPESVLPVNLWELWRREINLISSYSATPDLLPQAMALLRRPDYPLETTISHTLPLAEAAAAFQLGQSGQVSKVVVVR